VKKGIGAGKIFSQRKGRVFKSFLESILGPTRLNRGQDGPKQHIKSFKAPRNTSTTSMIFQCKNNISQVSEAPKTIIRGSGRLPIGA